MSNTVIKTDETMVVLPEQEVWVDDIHGKGTETEAEGGIDGEANTGLRGLVNRTAWLRKIVLQLQTAINNIDLSKYALASHSHPYLSINGKAVDADKLDGKDSSAFAPAHSHPYLPVNGKAVDADKLDGVDSRNFRSYAEFVNFENISYPHRNEESWGRITGLKQQIGRCFDVLPNGIIKFKQNGIYSIKIKIIGDSNIVGADKTRVKINAWAKANHFYPTNDRWDAVEVEIKCYLWAGYELVFDYDSGRLHTWHDSRFSYINITRIGQLQ